MLNLKRGSFTFLRCCSLCFFEELSRIYKLLELVRVWSWVGVPCQHFFTDILYSKHTKYGSRKAIRHFWNRNYFKVHRFTNNLQGLQKVMVKDFS